MNVKRRIFRIVLGIFLVMVVGVFAYLVRSAVSPIAARGRASKALRACGNR
jgi:phage shock protein PspC (stress-responsive transcriptional regulator)